MKTILTVSKQKLLSSPSHQLRQKFFLLGPSAFLRALSLSLTGPSEHRVTAISGTNVCLPISNLPAKYIQLTWFYTTNQKILEWESNQTLLFDSEFKGRVSLGQNQNLCIHNVQKNDSSTYILRVLTDSGTEKEWHTRLEVYGEFGAVPLQDPGGTTGRFPRVHGGSLWEEDRETSGQASLISPGATSSGE